MSWNKPRAVLTRSNERCLPRQKHKCPVCHIPSINDAYCIQCGYDYIKDKKAELLLASLPAQREES